MFIETVLVGLAVPMAFIIGALAMLGRRRRVQVEVRDQVGYPIETINHIEVNVYENGVVVDTLSICFDNWPYQHPPMIGTKLEVFSSYVNGPAYPRANSTYRGRDVDGVWRFEITSVIQNPEGTTFIYGKTINVNNFKCDTPSPENGLSYEKTEEGGSPLC